MDDHHVNETQSLLALGHLSAGREVSEDFEALNNPHHIQAGGTSPSTKKGTVNG